MAMNKQILLAARPVGFPKESDFRLVETPVPAPKDGEFRVKILWLSVDPYMRGRMAEGVSYAPSVQLGEVMVGGAAGVVEESRHSNYKTGDFVTGAFGWQQFAVSTGKGTTKVDLSMAPLSAYLGVLGIPGITAYFGLLDIGQLKAGESAVVSGAAGAVGSIAGQIAKIKGCRVVGIAGGGEKVRYVVDELGFDAAFDYKTETDYYKRIGELCPKGVDVYFDNVGGEITDAVFAHINTHARIAVCGQIAQYNLEKPSLGPRLLGRLIVKQARVEGFLVFQFADRYGEAVKDIAQWLRDGRIKYREQVAEEIESAPAAFIGMLKGANTGKQLVRIA
jgi:NADPH-dependent curcumin reductase CurA